MNEIRFEKYRLNEKFPNAQIERYRNNEFGELLTGCKTVGNHVWDEFSRTCKKCGIGIEKVHERLNKNINPIVIDTYVDDELTERQLIND